MSIALAPVSDGMHGKEVHNVGDVQVILATLAFSGSYVNNGEVVDFTELLKRKGAGIVHAVNFDRVPAGYQLDYDYTNKKVLVRQGDNPNAAAAPGSQLAAAGYPAALTGLAAGDRVRVTVWGL